jgi:hypothetical protein
VNGDGKLGIVLRFIGKGFGEGFGEREGWEGELGRKKMYRNEF